MENEIVGTSNRVLEVDLGTRRYSVYTVTRDERRMYLGAKGLGLKLLYDRIAPGIDPLGPDNMIAFMPGVLMGTGAPCSGRFDAVTKSPLTGIMVTSSCGGPFGMQLKTAGWDGCIVKGRSEKPVYILIRDTGVEFLDATEFWGLDCLTAQAKMTSKKQGAVVIGPAGENGVRYANAVSGERYLGRGGLGAVMGSKNLKGIVAEGGVFKILPADQKRFDKVKRKALAWINRNQMTSVVYRKYGTPANTNLSNAAGILPVNNFSAGSHPDAYKISGEGMKAEFDTKPHTCKPCSILCGKKGTFAGKNLPVPEFETVGLLGSNIGVFDPVVITEWNRLCAEMGMDTISAGGTIAWVMEAAKRDIIESPLRFGSPEGIADALMDIAYMRGFGAEMALGSRELSRRYGGEDFAIQVKGMEMAAYDPRGSFGQGLSYAVANRGACHLSAYLVSLEVYLGLLNPMTHRAKARFTKMFESLTCCINSLQTCQFTMFAYTLEHWITKYTPKILLGFAMQNFPIIALQLLNFSIYTELWSAATGIKISDRELLKAGDRIHVLERYMNTREGISSKDDTLPGVMLQKAAATQKAVPLGIMRKKYYTIRGYDAKGIPSPALLRKLGIMVQ